MAKKKYIPRALLSEEERGRIREKDRERCARKTPEQILRDRLSEKAWHQAHPESSRASGKRYRAKDPERKRAQARIRGQRYRAKRKALTGTTYHPGDKDYRRKNKSLLAQKNKAYRLQNALRVRANKQAWDSEHPEKNRIYLARRKARKANATINDFTAKQWRALCKAAGYRCAYCGKKFPFKQLTQDHITPLSKGGSHTLANIIPACSFCNSSKKDRAVLRPVQPFLLLDEDAAAD